MFRGRVVLTRWGSVVFLTGGCEQGGLYGVVNQPDVSTEVADSAQADSGESDSGRQDSGPIDTGRSDSGTTETGQGETGLPADTSDTGTIDEEIPTGDWIDIDAGSKYTCGVHADGRAECWGTGNDGDLGQLTPPPAVAFSDVETGGYLTCGLDEAGSIYCFGVDTFGEGTPPTGAFAALNVTYDYYTSATDSAGLLTVWGDCTRGGSRECTDPPSEPMTSVSALGPTCGIAADGTIACWGPVSDSILPPPEGVWSAVAVGDSVACALDAAGEATCWGDDTYAAYWGGTWDDAVANEPVGPFIEIGAGGSLACALREDRTTACWGYFGNLAAVPSYPLTKLSVGQFHSCGISELGGAVCWGWNSSGETDVPG